MLFWRIGISDFQRCHYRIGTHCVFSDTFYSIDLDRWRIVHWINGNGYFRLVSQRTIGDGV
ncbi:hypothetical protein, partial [Vibrio alginolyticus]|uniref:hypothetical protein n=1 Tax=Vibrio alginolyticus TaxID=663 RepID=UPI00285256A9